jgi:hypothetical protein
VKEPSIAASSRDRIEPWTNVTTVGGLGLTLAGFGRLKPEITTSPFGNGLAGKRLCACLAVGSLCQMPEQLNRRENERCGLGCGDKTLTMIWLDHVHCNY